MASVSDNLPVDTVLDTLAYNNLILDQVYFYHCLILLLHFCISRFSDGRQRCNQSMNIQRLSQMACHPCRKTLVHIRFGNIRCHGYDRYRISMVLIHFAEHLCRFQTIHHRHLHIHEDRKIASRIRRFKLIHGLGTILRPVHDKAEASEQLRRNLCIQCIILRKQNSSTPAISATRYSGWSNRYAMMVGVPTSST